MNRLTKKIEEGFYTAPNINSTDDLKYKLGKLEDIEEEIGIDLVTLFNIISGKQEIYIEEELFKNTCWGKYWKDVKCFICISFSSTFIHCDCWDEENFHGRMHTEVIPLKDYGITWALTKENLENE